MNRMLSVRTIRLWQAAAALALAALLLAAAAPSPAQVRRQDHISQLEADRIREAETPAARVRLFVGFAEDRLKKIEYELGRAGGDPRRFDRATALLNSYTGCIDDAAGIIEIARERQHDVIDGMRHLKSKAPEFLSYLEELSRAPARPRLFRDALLDAIDATKEALEEVEKGEKEIAPPPVRRRP